MSAPVFLSSEQIEKLHRASIEQFGGTLGVRDVNALESAIFHPQNVRATKEDLANKLRELFGK